MFILLIGSTDSLTTAEAIKNLASACLKKGHEVAVFFNAESTRLLKAKKADGFSEIVRRGVRLLACRTSAANLGMASTEDMIEGSEMSSLGELVDLMEASDRTLFLG